MSRERATPFRVFKNVVNARRLARQGAVGVTESQSVQMGGVMNILLLARGEYARAAGDNRANVKRIAQRPDLSRYFENSAATPCWCNLIRL